MSISETIWNMKYRFENEASPDETFRRVARALAAPTPELEEDFYTVLKSGYFIPAGRIIAGAGTGRNVTLSNCFTMGTIPDSIEGIFTALKEAALTMQQGGGIGYDFSTIRPKGAEVKGVAADASGPLSFMDVWDAMCRTIMSAGSRRGAMMATMRCDHPDIEAFIEAKRDPARLRMFNLSVLVTDAFMDAVKNDSEWPLVFGGREYRRVSARYLWDKIMRSTYAFAEPGVIFIDRVNRYHNLSYIEQIATTNPCGEKPMGPYASCLLGSINLAKLVTSPFTPEASINHAALAWAVTLAIKMMDNVIEVGNFPLPQQLEKAKSDRQLGLGITGLADALVMLGMEYGSPPAAKFTRGIMKEIALKAYETSVDLASRFGPFPSFSPAEFLSPPRFASRLPEELQKAIATKGIRNSLLISIAPTGTISIFADNVSSGIEPIFALEYKRKVLQPDGSKSEELVEDYAVRKFRELFPGEPLPPTFVTAQDLPPSAHVTMQAMAQEWVDSSISKTINLPEEITFEEFEEVYLSAYRSGCKGCTTYRPNDVTGSVLSVPAPKVTAGPPSRDAALNGKTYKIKWPGTAHAIYITINDQHGAPFEIFINSKNTDHYQWTVALTRMISAVFRRGGDIGFVPEELQAVFDPKGGAWVDGRYVPSLIAAIGDIIAQHMGKPISTGEPCPQCGSTNTKSENGCLTCLDCGHSKCG